MDKLTPSQNGAAAEAAIAASAIALGLTVLRPLGEGGRYDLVNNQAQRIRWARDYALESVLQRLRPCSGETRSVPG
jgi:hypothetical protein